MTVVAQLRLESLLWAIGTVAFIAIGSFVVAWIAEKIAARFKLSYAEQRKVFWGFLFASPWIIGFVIFVVGPALASLYYSFTDYKLGDPIKWTGLENFRTLLRGEGAHGRRFSQAMFNSFYYAIVGVPLQILAALGMALLLNQALRGVRLFRLIFYLPVILAGGPALLLAWRYMLTSNGGFINETLQRFSRSFFLFDWLHRGFIYSVEVFNGFYSGIAKGDPIGPLRYFFPAVIGAALFLSLVSGDWSPIKRDRARRFAEILTIIIGGLLIANGLVDQPVDPTWIYVGGALTLTLIGLNAAAHKQTLVNRWQIGGMVLAGIVAVIALLDPPDGKGATPYVIAAVIAAGMVGLSRMGAWDRRKFQMLIGAVVVLCAVIVVRLAPGQLDGGRLSLVPRYLTVSSTVEQRTDEDYLDEGWSAENMSPLWIYGLVIVGLGAAAILNDRNPRAQRYLLYGGLAVFGLMTISTGVDTYRYFHAYDEIAIASQSTNFHFALFNQAAGDFPDQTRVALWMSSELWVKPSLVLITMWSSGAGMLIFLAALKGVPRVLYESAEVDGANRIQRFFKITLPMISPALFYNIVIGVIASLQTFEAVYIFQTPQTEDNLMSAAYFLYQRTFRQLAIGQGSAVAWILAVVIVVLTAMQFRYSRWVHYEV